MQSFRRSKSTEGGLSNPVYDSYGAEGNTDVCVHENLVMKSIFVDLRIFLI